MAAPAPPPGWYPDPSGAPGQRYWDGHTWHTATPASVKTKPMSTGSKLLIAGGAIGGLVVLSAIGNATDDSPSEPTTTAPASAPTAQTTPKLAPGIGEPARDGKFEFVVTHVGTQSTIGYAQPRGQYIVVTMTVANVGDEPRSFFPGNQKLIDSAGREYAADTMAAAELNRESMLLDFNPGFKAAVAVPFDVPPGTQAAAVDLHDSAFSGGVEVRLAPKSGG